MINNYLSISYNYALSSVNIPSLSSIYGSSSGIHHNNSLISISIPTLTSIGRSMEIFSNYALTDINLSNLSSIIKNFYISDNHSLSSLDLPALISIGNFMSIQSNDALTSISLPSLTSINNDMSISYNNALTSISTPNLNSIGSYMRINENSALTSLSLPSLNSIGYWGRINNNDALSSISSPTLTSIGNDLDICCNNALTSIGFPTLTSIGNDLRIDANASLTSLSGLDNITSINGLAFHNNQNLSMCEIAPICNYLSSSGSSSIYNNAPGCNSDTEIITACSTMSFDCYPGGITFTTQQEINDFPSTNPSCVEIIGDVTIEEGISDNITKLDSLTQLTSLAGNLHINNNSALNDLSGLNQVTQIGGSLKILGNSALINLSGMDNVTTLGGYLHLEDNAAMTSLNGLNNLDTIIGYLEIDGNASLINIGGIGDIDSSEITDLTITNNTTLSACNITTICNYLDNPSNPAIVSNNAVDCNTKTEIETSCLPPSTGCLSGGIIFASQSDIDNFPSNYPDCTVVEGDVTINDNGQFNINNLDSLAQLTRIKGDLILYNTDNITSLHGLHNITTIGSAFHIDRMDGLADDLSDLINLTTIGGPLRIVLNDNLKSLSGLDNITEILIPPLTGDNLEISSNDALLSLQGLEGLTTINGPIRIAGNALLETLCGIGNIDPNTILGIENTNDVPLKILANPKLKSCELSNICDYLFGGGVNQIFLNDVGCNSVAQVADMCASPQVNMWIGPATDAGWYDTVANWSLNHFPIDCGNVHIPTGVTVNFDTGTSTLVNSMTVESGGAVSVMLGSEILVKEK